MADLRRRDLIASAGLLGPALLLRRVAAAAAVFPEKDITFVIPYGPGGGFDSDVRAVAPVMEKYLPAKVTIVPSNVPGGGGARGANQVYRAKPDGYTIGVFNIPGMFVLQQEGSVGYDLNKLTWLGSLGRDSYGLAVGADSPVTSVADLEALARTRPVKFTCTGPSSTAYAATRIAAELLGIKAQVITGYKGSNDYVLGAIRGDGDAAITALPLLRRLRAGGVIRILATFEASGTVPGAADATSLGKPELAQLTLERLVAAPPGLPGAVKTALAEALGKAMADPELVAWAKKADLDLAPATPEQAAAILQQQAELFAKWKKYFGAS